MSFKEAGKRKPQMQRYLVQRPRRGGDRFYSSKVDFEFLKGNGIRVVFYQPWQLGLFYEELEGKFLWYPSKGTLVFESEDGFFQRIGEKGAFVAGGYDADESKEYITEDVYNEIMKVVSEQQSL